MKSLNQETTVLSTEQWSVNGPGDDDDDHAPAGTSFVTIRNYGHSAYAIDAYVGKTFAGNLGPKTETTVACAAGERVLVENPLNTTGVAEGHWKYS